MSSVGPRFTRGQRSGSRGGPHRTLECVVNVSEGRRGEVIEAIAAAAGDQLLDIHTDPHHNRSVLTLVGEEAPRAVAVEAVARLDLDAHEGVHPRIGVVDVVPFVPLDPRAELADAVRARDAFGAWAGASLGLPAFVYGPERTLPAVRREAWASLEPDFGPSRPHPTAGAVAVGARSVLVAYNLWLTSADLEAAKQIAAGLRSAAVRTLGLPVGSQVQVSCNLIDPLTVGPDAIYDAVAALASIDRAELVGLVPQAVLDGIPQRRWAELDLAADRTIEARLEIQGVQLD